MRLRTLLAVVPALLLAGRGYGADGEKEKADRAKFQGKWEATVLIGADLVRVEREQQGATTTITRYNPKGEVEAKWASTFELEGGDKVTLFIFSNTKTLFPRERQNQNRGAYIYKFIGDDTFIEVHGVLRQEELNKATAALTVWTRMKEKK